MPTTVPVDVLNVLENQVETDGTELRIVGQLDRTMYTKVNKVLEAAGGKWNRGRKAHVFPGDAADRIEDVLTTGEYTDVKKEFDAFFTPPEVAARVIELADLDASHSVLEPSAGDGALAIPAAAVAHDVIGYELREGPLTWQHEIDNVAIQSGRDFLCVAGPDRFDRVVMNPPFSKQQDMKHVLHALNFLADDGLLVAVMSPAWQYRTSREAVKFREQFEARNGTVEELPAGAFRQSGTDVRTVIVTMEGSPA